MHLTFASLSSSELARHGFLAASKHVVQDLPTALFTFSSDLFILIVFQFSLIGSTCLNHFKIFLTTSSLISPQKSTLHLTSSILSLSILVTPHILLGNFMSIILNLCLSTCLIPQASLHASPLTAYPLIQLPFLRQSLHSMQHVFSKSQRSAEVFNLFKMSLHRKICENQIVIKRMLLNTESLKHIKIQNNSRY